MDTREIQRRLSENGFPCGPVDGVAGAATKQAVKNFQTAYCGPGGWLDIDGLAGPQTQRALTFLPRLSTHFTVQELWCKHCHKAYVHRELLSGLEILREQVVRGPVVIMSAYRCPEHNRAVGGKVNSMHPYGGAIDFSTYITVDQARRVGRFSGIGTRNGGRQASHVDVRGRGGLPNFTPGYTAERPMVYAY